MMEESAHHLEEESARLLGEESAHLGEEQVEPSDDQEVQAVSMAAVAENGLAESLQCQKEQTSDYLQEPQEAIAIIAVKSHSPYLLSRMSEDEEEEETAHNEDPVVIHVPCTEPLSGGAASHHPEHSIHTPSVATFGGEGSQPVVVVEEVNGRGGVVGEEAIQQAQPEVQWMPVDDLGSLGDVPVYQEGAGPEVEFGVGARMFSDDSKDMLSGD